MYQFHVIVLDHLIYLLSLSILSELLWENPFYENFIHLKL